MKVLRVMLELNGNQQAKIRPILQDLHDATQNLVDDERMSSEERLSKMRAGREKADEDIREVLDDDQKNRLDQLEHEPHSELHGDMNGSK